MIAVIAYSVAPTIRYTAHGLRQINPQLIEAGIAAGCTPRQLMTKIRIKLALPEIMLGINQTIMFALSMLVITALVGTRDLGQEVYIALTKADTGRGGRIDGGRLYHRPFGTEVSFGKADGARQTAVPSDCGRDDDIVGIDSIFGKQPLPQAFAAFAPFPGVQRLA